MCFLKLLFSQLKTQYTNRESDVKIKYVHERLTRHSVLPAPHYSNTISIRLIPPHILDRIRSMSKHHYTYSLFFPDYAWTVTIHFIDELTTIHTTDISKIIVWLKFVLAYTGFPKSRCMRNMTAYIYGCPIPKKIPNTQIPREPIGEANVNSAFTTACGHSSKIIIFRKEEWFKVFIHETFHTFGIDFASDDNIPTCNMMSNLFGGVRPSTKILLSESYTEVWARVISVFILQIFENPNHTFLSIRDQLERTMISERIHSLVQLTKILKYYKISYNNLFSKDFVHINNYTEKTNVIAYYIITSIMLVHLTSFVEWCEKNNDEDSSPIYFSTSGLNFGKWVTSHAQTDIMKEIVEKFSSRIGTKYTNDNYFCDANSLRMAYSV